MKRHFLAASLGLALIATPAFAQFHVDAHRAHANFWHSHPEHPDALLGFWHQHLFRRPITPILLNRFAADLRAGLALPVVLARMLASPEYYVQVGNSPAGFIQTMFLEVVGRPPTPPEYQFWVNRLYQTDRNTVAFELVLRYPPAWASQVPGMPGIPGIPGVVAPPVVVAPPPVVVAPPPVVFAPAVDLYEYRRPNWRYHR